MDISVFHKFYLEDKSYLDKYYQIEEEPLFYIHKDYANFILVGNKIYEFDTFSDNRHHIRANKNLVEIIQKLGKDASADNRPFKILDIPDEVEWELCIGDLGFEWIAEKHRIWY